MNAERILKTLLKTAAVCLTLPATLAVAGGLYPDQPILRVMVQAAGAVLVEGALLLGWHLLDNSKGKAEPAQLWLYTALVVVAFVGLNVIAVAHQEGIAGIVFRATLGVLIVYSIAESGILASIKVAQAADRDIASHRAVKRHRRTAAIRHERAAIDAEYAVKLAELQAGQSVTLQALDKQTARQLAAVNVEHKAGMAQLQTPQNVTGFPFPVDRARAAKLDRVKGRRRDIRRAIIDVARDNPHASLRELSDITGASHETVRRHLAAMESDGIIHRNGHGIEVLS